MRDFLGCSGLATDNMTAAASADWKASMQMRLCCENAASDREHAILARRPSKLYAKRQAISAS
jgi:hypothetical protein